MYVEIGCVGTNRTVCPPPSAGTGSPSGAPLLSTVQPSGAVTWKVNGALRSGCSKFANTRRASAGSYCV